MKKLIALLTLYAATNMSYASDCSAAYLKKVEDDSQKTDLQKNHLINKACIDTIRTPIGTVVNVNSEKTFEIKSNDGFSYTIRLRDSHICGNLLNFSKGQKITAKGKVERVWGSILKMHLMDSDCIK